MRNGSNVDKLKKLVDGGGKDSWEEDFVKPPYDPYKKTPPRKQSYGGTSYGIGSGGKKITNNSIPKTNQRQDRAKKDQTFNKVIDGTKNAFGSNFEKETLKSVSSVGKFAWVFSSRMALYGLVLGASLADIAGGAVALSLIFTNPIQFTWFNIGAVALATALSMATSGIQVLLLLEWTSYGIKKMNLIQSVVMFGIMIADTLLDMTVPYYLAPYHETPLTIQWLGKPAMFYVASFIFTMFCFGSERILLWVAKKYN